ncbi:MAG: heme-binding protein [Clostridia bacterium]|nr:heme-binding protein [Clostridia bacterium]
MNTDNYQLIAADALAQEQLLTFDHFTADDAWNLGVFLRERALRAGMDIAISIRKANGHILFQCCTQGTVLSNQKWMDRKFNTVLCTEGSSLRAWANLNLRGQTLQDQGLNPLDYAYCGGGFPIRLTSGEFIGAAIVSNLPHREDHRFIAGALAEYLHRENVPYV